MRTLIVVSGGDAPGINTVITRYLNWAKQHGDFVVGSRGGFPGLLADHIEEITERQVAPMAGIGGSILESSREPILAQADAPQRLKNVLQKHEIDNLLLFGGNGTLRYVLPLLVDWGIPTIGLPTTIDNDVPGTERTLGFDSACQFAYPLIEGVLATARALPGRIFLVETLGGDTGYIALAVAAGSGAHAVLVPEYEFTDEWLRQRILQSIELHGHALVVLSEGVPNGVELDTKIPALTGIRVRYTRLGHAQRGGIVSHIDRVLAHNMAYLAYTGFRSGIRSGTVIVRSDIAQLREGPLPVEPAPPPDYDLYRLINGLPA